MHMTAKEKERTMQRRVEEDEFTSEYVSTGQLPAAEHVQALIRDAYDRYKANMGGANSQVYPALARVPSDLFGICLVNTRGNVFAIGETEHEFTIMSVSKPFIFALVCQAIGPTEAHELI